MKNCKDVGGGHAESGHAVVGVNARGLLPQKRDLPGRTHPQRHAPHPKSKHKNTPVAGHAPWHDQTTLLPNPSRCTLQRTLCGESPRATVNSAVPAETCRVPHSAATLPPKFPELPGKTPCEESAV